MPVRPVWHARCEKTVEILSPAVEAVSEHTPAAKPWNNVKSRATAGLHVVHRPGHGV